VLLWGEPDIGRTAALTQLAASLDLPLTAVIASVHEPSDFSGLPIVGDDPAVQGVPMAPPQWAVELARAGRGLLFLDELSTATPAVQAALLRVVLERRVGALQLPRGVRIVAAANPRASAADGWELSPPLANRFVHLYWVHDTEVVVRGLGGVWPRAELPRLVPERLPEAVAFARRAVCGFLKVRPALIHRLPSTETRRGGAPEGWRRWADEAFHPPQPCRRLLGAAIRSAAGAPGAGENHSYRCPSRRSAGVPGVLLPGLRRIPPWVCVVVDTPAR
jgi:hypothetical protein